MEQKKKAAIYCRVSTKEQVEEGNSLHTQEKICKEYALKHGYEIARVFIELGESAKTADRTELKKLLAFCTSKKEKINAIIIYRIDRLSRQLEDYTVIKSKLKQSGVEIKSTAEYFEDNPAGRFMENIIANVAQFDNDVRTERSVNGMRDAVREGRYVWKAPVGYSNSRLYNRPNIVPNEHAPLVKEAFEMVARNNMPVEEVRHYLTNKFAGSNITVPSKSRFPMMLRNQLYAGWIIKFGEKHKGVFEPIVSESLFNVVQYAIDKRKIQKTAYRLENPDFPLRRFFFHPTGLKLTGAWSKGKNERYPYYFFRSPKCIYPKLHLETLFMELLNTYKLSGKHYRKLAKQIHEETSTRQEMYRENRTRYQQQIHELQQRQNAIIKKNLDGVIADSVLKQQLSILDEDIISFQELLEQTPKNPIDYNKVLDNIREFVEHPAETWKRADFKSKTLLQWFFFPKGVIFNGTDCRTPEICTLFKLKKHFEDTNSCLVPNPDFKSNISHSPHSPLYEKNDQIEYGIFWQQIAKEFIALSELKEKRGINGTDT